MSLPIISICGNLKRIESKFLPSGKQLVSFQVECSEKNAKGEWENLYIKGEVWEKSAKFVEQYFKEGSAAIVTGKLVTNVYEKQDGSKVYENKFLFPNVTFAPKDKEVQQQTQQQPYNAPQQPQINTPTIDADDTIPF
tara:strand:+ start:875 stop:1288 length:414 start_codon:yes stop_codon:yes gene_type:complete